MGSPPVPLVTTVPSKLLNHHRTALLVTDFHKAVHIDFLKLAILASRGGSCHVVVGWAQLLPLL